MVLSWLFMAADLYVFFFWVCPASMLVPGLLPEQASSLHVLRYMFYFIEFRVILTLVMMFVNDGWEV